MGHKHNSLLNLRSQGLRLREANFEAAWKLTAAGGGCLPICNESRPTGASWWQLHDGRSLCCFSKLTLDSTKQRERLCELCERPERWVRQQRWARCRGGGGSMWQWVWRKQEFLSNGRAGLSGKWRVSVHWESSLCCRSALSVWWSPESQHSLPLSELQLIISLCPQWKN